MKFYDVGAVAWILRKCVWWIPDFSVAKYLDGLVELDAQMRNGKLGHCALDPAPDRSTTTGSGVVDQQRRVVGELHTQDPFADHKSLDASGLPLKWIGGWTELWGCLRTVAM
jgi:hypothetical protein